MSNKKTLQTYNERLSTNTTTIDDILTVAENLPNSIKGNKIFTIDDFIQKGSTYDTDGYTMSCVSNVSSGFNAVYLKEVTDGTYYITTTTTKGTKANGGFWYVYRYDGSYFYVINLKEKAAYRLNTSGGIYGYGVGGDNTSFARAITYDETLKIVVSGKIQTIYINDIEVARLNNCNTIGAGHEGSASDGSSFVVFTNLYKEATDSIKLQVKTIDVTKLGQITITPDEGYDAIARLKINVALNGGGYDMNYELGEKRIGTWVNGKPLYRYVLRLTSGWTIGGEVQLPHNIEDAEEMWLENAFWRRSDGNDQIIPNTHSDFTTWGTGVYDFTPTHFRLYMGRMNGMSIQYIYIIFNYTKTTDEVIEEE